MYLKYLLFCNEFFIWGNTVNSNLYGGVFMKGYIIDAGYMGYVDGEYELFATEDDYLEYMAA